MQQALPETPAPPAFELPRWAKRLVLVLWLPLVIVAVAAPVGGAILQQTGALGGNPLERVGLSPLGPLRPLSQEASRSGFRLGDRVIAVDGTVLANGGAASASPELEALLSGPEGTSVELVARSPDGTVRSHRLTRSASHLTSALSAAGLPSHVRDGMDMFALVASFALAAAAVLLFIRGRQRVVPTLLSFGLSILGITLLTLGLLANAGLPFGLPMLVLGFSLLMLALLLFPDGTFYPRWMRWTALLLIVLTPVGMLGLMGAAWTALHTAFLVAAVGSVVARYRHLPVGQKRQQVRWALFGFGVAAIIMVPVQLLELVVIPSDVPLAAWLWSFNARNALNILLLLAVAAGLIVSLLRYRLYDADAVIARSVSFGALALVLVALFAGTEKVIEVLGERWLGGELGVLAGGIGAAVAALMVVPLHHRLSHWAEHRFQKQLIQLRTGLPALVGDLRETAPSARIAAASLDWIVRGVRATRAALVVNGRLVEARGIAAVDAAAWLADWAPAHGAGLDSDRADSLFPLRIPLDADGHGRIGWLLLGPRPDGSFYGRDERQTLAQVADPIARALEIAGGREARETAERERWRAQEALNAELRTVHAELLRVLGSLDGKLERLVSPPELAPPLDKPRRRARRPTAQ